MRRALRLKCGPGVGHDGRSMSLNRSEQMVCDYVDDNPEELRYWRDTVKRFAAEERDRHRAAAELAEALWSYFEERAQVVSPFREMAAAGGVKPTSMRNLAEYWLRLWAPPPPKKKANPF